MPARTIVARTVAGWMRVEFFGPQGVEELARVWCPPGSRGSALTAEKEPVGEAITMPPGQPSGDSDRGAGFVRMRGRVALDDRSTSDDIEGAVRFFIFGAEPDPGRLVRVAGAPPVPAPARIQERR